MDDFEKIYAALEEARRKEKRQKQETLAAQLEALVQESKAAQDTRDADVKSAYVSREKDSRKLKEKTAGAGLLRSGYMDSLLEGRKGEEKQAVASADGVLADKKTQRQEKEKNLRLSLRQALENIDRRYNDKVETQQQREKSQREAMERQKELEAARAAAAAEKEALAKAKEEADAAAKAQKEQAAQGQTNTAGKKTSTTAGTSSSSKTTDKTSTATPGHLSQISDTRLRQMLDEKGLASNYISDRLDSAIHSGNVRAWMEENSPIMMREAGEEIWNEFMRRYKDYEYWDRIAKNGGGK